MSDYAAAPIQPIAQGLVTVFTQELGPTVLTFFGKGIIQSGPLGALGVLGAPVALGPGDYLLSLDQGLPGDVAIDPAFARFMITLRAPLSGFPTPVLSKSLSYIVSPTPGVGVNQLRIEFASGGLPEDVSRAGFEFILWRGDAGVELTNVNLVGGPQTLFRPGTV